MPIDINSSISNNNIKISHILFCIFPIQLVCGNGQIIYVYYYWSRRGRISITLGEPHRLQKKTLFYLTFEFPYYKFSHVVKLLANYRYNFFT
jgi:hypothetical protein